MVKKGEISMKKKNITQKDMVLKFMREKGSITTFQAFYYIGATRLPDIIFKLKKKGYKIHSERITKKGRYGNIINYCKYTLEEGKND